MSCYACGLMTQGFRFESCMFPSLNIISKEGNGKHIIKISLHTRRLGAFTSDFWFLVSCEWSALALSSEKAMSPFELYYIILSLIFIALNCIVFC